MGMFVCSGVGVMLTPVLAEAAEHGQASPSLFGGDFGTAIWTLVIFILLLIVLGKFAWGPLLRTLQNREQFIRESLESAKAEREQAEARLREYTEQLRKAQAEAGAILDQGRREAELLKRRIQDEARSEAEALLARARREITLARDTAVKELYDLTADLAVDVAARLVRRELSEDDHRRLVQEAIGEIQALRIDTAGSNDGAGEEA